MLTVSQLISVLLVLAEDEFYFIVAIVVFAMIKGTYRELILYSALERLKRVGVLHESLVYVLSASLNSLLNVRSPLLKFSHFSLQDTNGFLFCRQPSANVRPSQQYIKKVLQLLKSEQASLARNWVSGRIGIDHEGLALVVWQDVLRGQVGHKVAQRYFHVGCVLLAVCHFACLQPLEVGV